VSIFSSYRSSLIFLGLGVFLPLGTVIEAQAGAFTIRSQSAAGYGTVLAGVAAGGNLSYAYWNPAALADIDSLEISGVASGILPSFRVMPDAATNAIVAGLGGTPSGSVDVTPNAFVPATFFATPVNDRLTFGVATTSPFGLATKAPANWAGQVYSRDSEIFSLNVNPMVSYRISDRLSVGAGVQFQHFKADLTQAISPVPGAPDISLRASDLGVGFNLGIRFKPMKGTSIGLGYRSSISHSLKGRVAMPGARIPVRTRMETPDIVSLGIRQEVTDRFRLLGTVEWNHWSRMGQLPVQIAGTGATITTLHMNYRDGWLFSAGGEYDLSESITLRGGVGYETSPVTDANRDTRLPEVDQFMLAAGFTYRHNERLSVDASFLQSFGLGTGRIDIGPDDPRFVGLPFHGTSKVDVSVISVGLNYRFDGPLW
jgi:long-chain fatty acid transport protein